MSKLATAIWSKFPPGVFLRGRRTGVNDPRRVFVRRKIASESPERFLDIPCGPGIDLEGLGLDGARVGQYIGCDITLGFLQYCKKRFPKAELIRCSVEHLPFMNGSIDIGSSKDLLEHLPAGAEPALKELLRVCSRRVFISWFIPPMETQTKMGVKYPYSNALHRLYVFLLTAVIGKIQFNLYNVAEIQHILTSEGATLARRTTVGHNFNHERCEVWEILPPKGRRRQIFKDN